MGLIETVTGFVGNAGSNIFETVIDTVDRFVHTRDEAESVKSEIRRLQADYLNSERRFRLQLHEQLVERDKMIEATIRAELDARKSIMLAELHQGDRYTKRARPTILYAGLVMVAIELFGIRPFILNHMRATETIVTGSEQIFQTFLWVWAGVAGVYTIGRSAEKFGKTRSWLNAMSDSETASSPSDTVAVRAILDKIRSGGVNEW